MCIVPGICDSSVALDGSGSMHLSLAQRSMPANAADGAAAPPE